MTESVVRQPGSDGLEMLLLGCAEPPPPYKPAATKTTKKASVSKVQRVCLVLLLLGAARVSLWL